MKILHVITSLYTGGAEKLMVDLLPILETCGLDVELCVFDGTRTPFMEELEGKGIRIHSFDVGGNVYSPLNIYRLWHLIRKGKYDIVHTHNTAPELYAAILKKFCKFHLVTTEHSTSNRRREIKWYQPIDRWMFRQYDVVICISDQSLANHCSHVGSENGCNATVIYNGIDYNKYKNACSAEDVRCFSSKIITNVAGFRAPKDQPTLIRALNLLPVDFHLCLVGDGDRRAEYERLIDELKLTDRVHLLGLRSDIPEVLAASDYVVMCSHYEGLSLSSLEGMSSGKPFLADNVDGLREIVDGYGVLFEHEDAKGFAEAILQLDGDADYRNRVVRSCQEKAAQYDISVMAKEYLKVYERILS